MNIFSLCMSPDSDFLAALAFPCPYNTQWHLEYSSVNTVAGPCRIHTCFHLSFDKLTVKEHIISFIQLKYKFNIPFILEFDNPILYFFRKMKSYILLLHPILIITISKILFFYHTFCFLRIVYHIREIKIRNSWRSLCQ